MKELKGIENTLPEKWAIKTNRNEFYYWLNANKQTQSYYSYNKNLRFLYPALNGFHAFKGSEDTPGYELITFERWASVYRPDLVNTPEIPERWCVRRTPENAEILQAWFKRFFPDSTMDFVTEKNPCYLNYENRFGFFLPDGSIRGGITEITFEQWQTIPENILNQQRNNWKQ